LHEINAKVVIDVFTAWEQHDIQELLRTMLDALEATWQNTEQANLIKELYEGKMEDCIKCLRVIQFYILILLSLSRFCALCDDQQLISSFGCSVVVIDLFVVHVGKL
jgi:hypothetical protein